jgi:hypothetical protein
MKILITEEQHDDLIDMMTDLIKSDGWSNTAKLVGGNENLIELLGITSPMDFLHLFDDMVVVRSKKRPNWALFRYVPHKNLMVYDKKDGVVWFDNSEIWSDLVIIFGLKNSEIKQITKDWLEKVYNLMGVTTDFSGSTFRDTTL